MSVSDADLRRLQNVLNGWRTSLIDMGGRNRLLNFRHTKVSTLEITAPDIATLASSLGRGLDFAPVPGEAEGQESAPACRIVTQKTAQAALNSSLYRLSRHSRQMYNDYGLWVLWLGIGMLE